MKLPDLADHPNIVVGIGWLWLAAIVAGGVACTLDKF